MNIVMVSYSINLVMVLGTNVDNGSRWCGSSDGCGGGSGVGGDRSAGNSDGAKMVMVIMRLW